MSSKSRYRGAKGRSGRRGSMPVDLLFLLRESKDSARRANQAAKPASSMRAVSQWVRAARKVAPILVMLGCVGAVLGDGLGPPTYGVRLNGATVPFVESVIVPAQPASSLQVRIEGSSYHEVQWTTYGWGFLGMGERLYAQRAYLAGVQVLDIRWAYPALTTSYLPPGTTLTFVFLDSFQGQVTIPDPGLEADTAVEFAGNSLVNGWSRSGSWRIASRATQSILGTATPIE